MCESILSQLTPPVKGGLPVPRSFQENMDMAKAFDEIINSRFTELTWQPSMVALGINDKANEGQYVENENGKQVLFNNYNKPSASDDKNDNMVMFLYSASWGVTDDNSHAYVICQQDCKTG